MMLNDDEHKDIHYNQYNQIQLKESQPFMHGGILDTLESQSLPLVGMTSNKNERNAANAPNFGSLLQGPNGGANLKKDSYEQSQVRPLDHKSMMNIQGGCRLDKLKVVLICSDEKELIKDVPL